MSVMDVGLPKWPCCEVRGEDVTTEQAADIILRTTGYDWLSCNDKAWDETVRGIFDIKVSDGYPEFTSVDALKKRFNALDLEFLSNNRISSAYIHGPGGWCNWDGMVYNSGHNIGKWPAVEDVMGEWRGIAEAFPYLNLRCQLFSGENVEPGAPLIEFRVSAGSVTASRPSSIMEPHQHEFNASALFSPFHERGCTEEFLIETVRKFIERNGL